MIPFRKWGGKLIFARDELEEFVQPPCLAVSFARRCKMSGRGEGMTDTATMRRKLFSGGWEEFEHEAA